MKHEARALAARSGFACAKANSPASSSSYYISLHFPPAYAFYGRYVVVVPREVYIGIVGSVRSRSRRSQIIRDTYGGLSPCIRPSRAVRARADEEGA